MDIKPLDLPSAAGLEFGRGDVRHFSEDDAVNVPGLQNPTRQLAQRDNLLAAKVNELVGNVNNKEQFVPLVLPKTTVPPGVEEILTNFKIPDGFEARVINAAIASNPATSALALKIYYATGYGNLTGTELVSTTSAFTAGIAFYNDGEFIVSVRNNGSATIDAAVSITLTIRPVGSQASLLVGSVIRGPRGYIGGKGDPGAKGGAGVGGAGSAGMVWSGYFYGSNTYGPPQVVSFSTGGVVSSYISKTLNSSPSAAPPNSIYWDIVAQGGTGITGAGLNYLGNWSPGTSYVPLDTVNHAGFVYTCILAVGPSATVPGSDSTHWSNAASASTGETPVYSVSDLSPSTSYAATVTGPNDGIYGAVASSGSLPCREYSGTNTVGISKGLVFLYSQFNLNLPATSVVTVTLPTSVAKAGDPWTNAEVSVNASAHGTFAGTAFFDLDKPAPNQWKIRSLAETPVHVDVTLFGMKIT